MVIRVLSSVCLIDSMAFAELTSAKQTETLAQNGGKPIKFVDSFSSFGTRKSIREALLAGKNTDVELEFRGVILTDAEKAAIKAVEPLLAKIEAIPLHYPWVEAQKLSVFRVTDKKIMVNNEGIAQSTAKKVWDVMSRYWSGGPNPDGRDFGYNTLRVDYNGQKDNNRFGCKSFTRAQAEALARKMKWQPVIFEG